MKTLYWEVNYKGETGWKIKYYFGNEEEITEYVNKRLKFDKIEIFNCSLEKVKLLEEIYKVKFQVCK